MTQNCGYITTYTGLAVCPAKMTPGDMRIADIAHALSMLCRFTGHVKEFYSVATHSIACSLLVPREDALWGLLHDAAEAYLADIASPVKAHLPNYRSMEGEAMRAIAERYRLAWPEPPSVALADKQLVCVEAENLFLSRPSWCPIYRERYGVSSGAILPVKPQLPAVGRMAFLARFNELQTNRS